jgi:hypothetical protein
MSDGAITIEFIGLFGICASRQVFEPSQKHEIKQPHAPQPTAVLLSRRRNSPSTSPPSNHAKTATQYATQREAALGHIIRKSD